jgi:hypothetical protein
LHALDDAHVQRRSRLVAVWIAAVMAA